MASTGTIEIDEVTVPIHRHHTIIIGSGAAGLNCAHMLRQLGVEDIAIVTSGLGSGTSANSGSDKQTYYKMSVFGDAADSPLEFARTLTAGGMCHGDIAYVEALGSLPAFFNLVRNGVEFPHNRYGAYVGYKTDYDPRQRATSAGPRTSMQMVDTSLQRVRDANTPIYDRYEVVRLMLHGEKPSPGAHPQTEDVAAQWAASRARVIGAIALDETALDGQGCGLAVFLADYVVLATGGPGELYQASVYPRGQTGTHGLALEIGCRANNLTESQFGIASTGFRWNLSGSYQQVIPCYFSNDESGGDERFFLNDYFPAMARQATNIFLKGYQWPFDADKLQDFGSSIIDIAVHQQRAAGRRVFIDFTRNPVPAEGLQQFSIEALAPEAADYLRRCGATQDTPYQRLQHMNPLAIDIYTDNGVDLREPLEIDVCAQHCNGGLTVDIWWRTNVPGLFAIGEVAGTHGVRPGGSALNSGQVGGRRAAQYIAHCTNSSAPTGCTTERKTPDDWRQTATDELRTIRNRILAHLNAGPDCPTTDAARKQIQQRMTRYAGFIRSLDGVNRALQGARQQRRQLAEKGQRLDHRRELIKAFQNDHLCTAHIAFLTAIRDLIAAGAGSRGSYMILDEAGDRSVETKRGRELPHRGENIQMRNEILEVGVTDSSEFDTFITPVRPIPDDESWFENTWRAWREGRVYR